MHFVFPEFELFKSFIKSCRKVKQPWKDFMWLLTGTVSIALVINIVIPQASLGQDLACGIIYSLLSYLIRDLVRRVEKDGDES